MRNEISLGDLEEKDLALFASAKTARHNAFAPFSKFLVGAAIRLSDGSIHMGCNVENASYGLTCCAERVAIFSAVCAGNLKSGVEIEAVFVVTDPPDDGQPAAPCGSCRGVIAQFDTESTSIYAANPDGTTVLAWDMGELLPASFEREFSASLQKQ